MHPVLTVLHIGAQSRELGTFGACFAFAVVLTAALTLRACVRDGFEEGAVIVALGCATAGGFVGAYAAFVLVSMAQGASFMHALTHPGLVFYGGALGAALAFVLSARALRLRVLRALDLAAPVLPVGHALGRLGCFFGGCCFGAPSQLPWSVIYTDSHAPAAALHVPRHPWPLYEAAALLMLSVVLQRPRAMRKSSREGALFVCYVAAYGCVRFVLEPLRGDDVRGLFLSGAVSTAQLTAAFTALLALGYLLSGGLGVRRMGAAGLLVALVSAASAAPAAADRVEHLALHAPERLRVPAGSVWLGSSDEDVAAAVELCKRAGAARCAAALFEAERPVRKLRIDEFHIDRVEVSQGAYRRCAAAGVCAPLESPAQGAAASDDDLPVASVTWSEAVAYCRFAGGRLPTEAEWERAARGGSARRFPWGSAWNGKLANHGTAAGEADAGDGFASAAPVTAFPDGCSAYGALQMAGNVWEWVADAVVGAVTDTRVIRGGSFLSPPHALRVAYREHLGTDQRRADVGLRCAYPGR